MERRLYYSTPNLDVAAQCQSLAKELNLAEDNFSVVSLNTQALLDRKLRAADYLKSLDLPRCSYKGFAFGFAGGTALVTLLALIQPYGFTIPAQLYWIPVLTTSCFGLWLGIMIGLSTTHHHLQPIKHKLKKGGSIIIIDVTQANEQEVEQIFRQRIPQAKLEKVTDLAEPLFKKTG